MTEVQIKILLVLWVPTILLLAASIMVSWHSKRQELHQGGEVNETNLIQDTLLSYLAGCLLGFFPALGASTCLGLIAFAFFERAASASDVSIFARAFSSIDALLFYILFFMPLLAFGWLFGSFRMFQRMRSAESQNEESQ